jgi:uncharacterized protein (DUF362 family)
MAKTTDILPVATPVGVVKPRDRTINRFVRSGKSLVSVVHIGDDLKTSVRRSLDLIGGLRLLIDPGDSVLLKPNLVRDNPAPCSTPLDFLGAVVELLREAGAGDITIAEHTGIVCEDTKAVFHNLGYDKFAAEMGVRLLAFEDDDWLEVEIPGYLWNPFLVPKSIYEANKRIYLPCLKVHRQARYTNALKMPVGCTHLGQRRLLHEGTYASLERRVAELNLVWQPDLIITDGRKSFVTGGPANGDIVEPGLVIASGDPVAIDVEAVRILQRYPADNGLTMPAWETPVIAHAVALGLGARNDAEVEVIREE